VSAYHGVVHNNTVILEPGVELPEGAAVQVRVFEPTSEREHAFIRVLQNRIPHSVGMEEIIEEDKRAREEKADRWLL